MAAKSDYTKRGRYVYGGSVVDYGNRLGWWERTNIPTDYSDLTVVIRGKYIKRPDLVAYDIYGFPSLQWLILQYNNILDIQTEFVAGVQLKVPTKSRVMTEILAKRQPILQG